MNENLRWLAINAPDWDNNLDRIARGSVGVDWFSSERFPGRIGFSREELLQARRDLGLVTTEGEEEAFDVVEQKQARYQDTAGEDWIDEAARTFTPEEFRGAMRFSIGKYNRRMGKKDELIKEIEKMRDYAARWIDVEKSR